MAEFINIKRKPPMDYPLYDPIADQECYDHCVTLNAEDLEKIEGGLPQRGDLIHVQCMGKVVGVHDDNGYRCVRIEIEQIMMVENESTEMPDDEGKE